MTISPATTLYPRQIERAYLARIRRRMRLVAAIVAEELDDDPRGAIQRARAILEGRPPSLVALTRIGQQGALRSSNGAMSLVVSGLQGSQRQRAELRRHLAEQRFDAEDDPPRPPRRRQPRPRRPDPEPPREPRRRQPRPQRPEPEPPREPRRRQPRPAPPPEPPPRTRRTRANAPGISAEAQAAAAAAGGVRTVAAQAAISGSSRILSASEFRILIAHWASTNAALIARLEADTLDGIAEALARAVQDGQSVRRLGRILREEFGIADRRAKTIARNELGNLHGAVTQARHAELGVEEYVWSASDDEQVRPIHRELDGDVRRWDDPHPTEGHPAMAINCRCVALPVIRPIRLGNSPPQT